MSNSTSRAIGKAEQAVRQARVVIRNWPGRTINQSAIDEMVRLSGAIEMDWRVPMTIRKRLKNSIDHQLSAAIASRHPKRRASSRHLSLHKTGYSLSDELRRICDSIG